MFSLRYLDTLPPAVADELTSLLAQIKGFLDVSFTESGTLRTVVEDPGSPIGIISPWSIATAPTGWLLCNGAQVSRDTYQALFNVIGTTYGAGDGSTTFTLPDIRGKFVLGLAASGTGSTLAGTGGSIDHTHTGPSHTHTGPAHTHTLTTSSDGAHTHTGPSHTHSVSGTTSSDIGTDYRIVASDSHDHATPVGLPTLTASVADDEHDHGFSTTTGAEGTGATSSSGAHTHTSTTDSSGTGATGASGTGATGTANPPFISLPHIIRYA